MKIIDGHTHIGKWTEVFLNYSTDVKDAVRMMKKYNIDSAVAMPANDTTNEELLNQINEQNDYKFYFCAWINPDDKYLDNFIDNNLNLIRFFKVHPSFLKKRITDDSFKKYLQIAIDNKIPVIVHCGRWQEMASYKFPIETAKKYPELKIILAHLGGDQPNLCINAAQEIKESNLKNVFLGTESVREFYFVERVVKIAGAEKVIFGSDYNLCLPATFIPIIESLNNSNSEKEMIFSGNILSLINEQ
ncbi:MAG: amidohydrolase family protein [Ignavibacteria bacterium]|nr:amidohydrolase family protein [Ignavibacteria bacterium]